MSYILEALKKAQAERQLGNAPTIHAAQPVQASEAAGGASAASRKPLLLGLGAGALVVLAGAALMWQRAPQSGTQTGAQGGLQAAGAGALQAAPAGTPGLAAAPARGGTSAPAPASPALAAAPSVSAAPPTSAATTGSNAAGAQAVLAVRAPDTPPPAAPRVAEAPARHDAPAAQAAAQRARAGADVPADTRVAASAAGQPSAAPRATQAETAPAAAPRQPAAAAHVPAPAPEDSLPLLRQLPESLQSQIPRVAFGGYMYSADPADRLLLVDKVLRHEGEEVAPGLVLEKLLPRAAVMNFRGVRYRAGY